MQLYPLATVQSVVLSNKRLSHISLFPFYCNNTVLYILFYLSKLMTVCRLNTPKDLNSS